MYRGHILDETSVVASSGKWIFQQWIAEAKREYFQQKHLLVIKLSIKICAINQEKLLQCQTREVTIETVAGNDELCGAFHFQNSAYPAKRAGGAKWSAALWRKELRPFAFFKVGRPVVPLVLAEERPFCWIAHWPGGTGTAGGKHRWFAWAVQHRNRNYIKL